jgi:hypothetical protein
MNSPDAALLMAAVAVTPASVLRSLAAAGAAPDLPAVTVYLVSGQVLDGRLVTVGTDHGHEVVVLAVGPQLAYAQLADIRAVGVGAPERYRDILSGGALPMPATGDPVTRLGLRRDFPPSPEFPLDVDWDALPDSAEALANLARLLDGLRTATAEVCADELGRRAWAAIAVLRVEHRTGTAVSVQAGPDALSVRADLTAALPRQLTDELRRQLNSVL